MSAAAFADSLLLVIAAAALLAGSARLSAPLTEALLPRLLSSVVLAAALAVAEALVLGLAGLSGSPAALTAAAVLTWLIAWRLVPAPSPAPTRAHVAVGLGALAGAGAAGGGLAALAATQLHRPVLGQDAITYHLPEVIGFVQSGHAGRGFDAFYGLPVGNYPLTEEVLLSWVTGISHGYAALLLLTLATVPLLALAGWVGLGELGVGAPIRALAIAALLFVPLVCQSWTQPGTDLEALGWLACSAALCGRARDEPGLLAPAIVAAGLAIGTKTTVLTWSVVILAASLWWARAGLRARWRSLSVALVLALGTGAVWYLRNWVEHGSPLWPFASFPGGDPRPQIIDYLSTSLLQSFQATLLDHLDAYASALSGGVVVIVGGILIAVPAALTRRRRLLLAGVVVLAGALEYALGPVTGLPPHGGLLVGVVGSTLRYLMPVFAAGALALALAAADPHPLLRALGLLGLAGTLVWDLISDLPASFDLAYGGWLWPGIVLGALTLPAAVVLARRRTRRPDGVAPTAKRTPSRPLRLVVVSVAGLLTAFVLAAGATHFSFRHAVVGTDFAAPVANFLATQPAFVDSDVGLASSKTGMGDLAGDRLQHPLSVIPEHARCAAIIGLRADHWLVVAREPAATSAILARVAPYGSAPGCLAGVPPAFDDGQYAVYAPARGGWWSYPAPGP